MKNFSLLYGIISYDFSYYGEMLTYVGMTMPMAVFALISWLRHPYKGKKSEVKVNSVSKKELLLMFIASAVISIPQTFSQAYLRNLLSALYP